MEFFLVRILPYSVQIRENTDQKNPVFGHFSHIKICYQALSNGKEVLFKDILKWIS